MVCHRPGSDPRVSLELATALRAQPLLLSQVARTVRQEHSFVARARQLLAELVQS